MAILLEAFRWARLVCLIAVTRPWSSWLILYAKWILGREAFFGISWIIGFTARVSINYSLWPRIWYTWDCQCSFYTALAFESTNHRKQGYHESNLIGMIRHLLFTESTIKSSIMSIILNTLPDRMYGWSSFVEILEMATVWIQELHASGKTCVWSHNAVAIEYITFVNYKVFSRVFVNLTLILLSWSYQLRFFYLLLRASCFLRRR